MTRTHEYELKEAYSEELSSNQQTNPPAFALTLYSELLYRYKRKWVALWQDFQNHPYIQTKYKKAYFH